MATSCFSTEHLDDKGNKAVTVTFNKVVSKASGGKQGKKILRIEMPVILNDFAGYSRL